MFITMHFKLILMAGLLGMAVGSVSAQPQILARVNIAGSADQLGSAVAYVMLQDAAGQAYALVKAHESDLHSSDWSYQALGTNIALSDCFIATARRPAARAKALQQFEVLHDDGRQMIVRASAAEAAQLSDLGFELVRLFDQPLIFNNPCVRNVWSPEKRQAPTYDPLIAEIIGQVQSSRLYSAVAAISGAGAALVEGALFTVSTRYTYSGTPIQKAGLYMYNQFVSSGLRASYQEWTSGSRNWIGELGGTSRSNEIVLIVGHLDSVPSSGPAPGADDNASGSVGVLTAAQLLSRFAFERTLRFVLFTGEEQGLLGARKYAGLVYSNSENVVAVFNMDMMAWEGNGNPVARLHTRTTSNPGYSNDLVIAQTFTNVVGLYGLVGGLTPVITADGESASDHYRFWEYGYPAILAIEDDDADFNPYYHSTNDWIRNINWNYYEHYVKAAVGTAAHLARPVGRVDKDTLEIANGDWVVGSGLGIGTLYLRHQPGALEGMDAFDAAWSNSAPGAGPYRLQITTAPYGTQLATDARPTNSATYYYGALMAVATNGLAFSCTNRLHFDFPVWPDSNRAYLARVRVADSYAIGSNLFEVITNIRQVVAGGGYLNLPALTNLTNGAIYGSIEIGPRFLDLTSSNVALALLSVGPTQYQMSVSVQAGARVVDTLQARTNLMAGAGWFDLARYTNAPPPTLAGFTDGWETVEQAVPPGATTNSAAVYLRTLRQIRPAD